MTFLKNKKGKYLTGLNCFLFVLYWYVFYHRRSLCTLPKKIMRETGDNLCSPEAKAFHDYYYFCFFSIIKQSLSMNRWGENILTF